MANAKRQLAKPVAVMPSLTAVLGVTRTLPGESEEEYQHGLQAVIQELNAKTVMQVYLAEKIFDCLWWMRRYEQQKKATLAAEMALLLTESDSRSKRFTKAECQVMDLVMDPSRCKEFLELLKETNYTEQSLMQAALSNKHFEIANLNTQVTTLAKTLAGFQASYEVLVHRKLNTERLRLQNEILSRDLMAIETEALPDAGQPKKTRRKQA